MPKKRKRKEIVVDAPPRRRREEALLRDTTRAEAFSVSKASMKVGKYLSGLMIIFGASISLFSVYSILVSAQFLFSDRLFISALGFLGAVNIFCGLILLAKE